MLGLASCASWHRRPHTRYLLFIVYGRTLCHTPRSLHFRTPKGPQPKATGEKEQMERKTELTVSTVCGRVCVSEGECLYAFVCLHVQWECTLTVQSWAPLFFCSFRIECMLFAQLELVQCGGDREAILFHWGLSLNKVITAVRMYLLTYLTTMLCNTICKFWDAFWWVFAWREKLRNNQNLLVFIPSNLWLSKHVWWYLCYERILLNY